MAAMKENAHNTSSSSSSSLRPSPRPLRSPLSPILPQNSSRPPVDLPKPSLRSPPLRQIASSNPKPTPRRLPALPLPNPSRPSRKLLPDLPAPKDPIPSRKLPKNSICVPNPSRSKRQNPLFVQKPSFADKGATLTQRWLQQLENEKNQRPCRRRWRRLSRERAFHGMAADMANKDRGVECGKVVSSRDGKCLLQSRFMPGNLCHDLSFDVFMKAGNLHHEAAATATDFLPELPTDPMNHRTAAMATHFLPELPTDPILASNCEALNAASPSRVVLDDELMEGSITPPIEKSLTPTDKNPTPPMQPTLSPDFIKRGARGALPISGECFGAQRGLVKDRRKCKPRGVLTVGHEIQTSTESEAESRQSVQMPTPAVASVEWMVDDNFLNPGPFSSSEFASTSKDLCRMSFPRLSLSHMDSSSEDEIEKEPCGSSVQHQEIMDACRRSLLQASTSVSGYDWGASSSQGMNSSCHTEASSAYPGVSIVLHEESLGNEFKKDLLPAIRSSPARRNILMKKDTEKLRSSMVFSQEEDEDTIDLPLSMGSPPFECSLLGNSFEDMDSYLSPHALSTAAQNSWSNSPPDEVLLSPTVASPFPQSSLSSQEESLDTGSETPSISLPNRSPFSDKQNIRFQVNNLRTEMQSEGEISSHIAMAELLCNLTAAYLDQVATCLGKVRGDFNGRSARNLLSNQTKLIYEKQDSQRLSKLSIEHTSSLLTGRKNMAECCSLLRGLTMETSVARDNNSASSEGSVNQPSPYSREDTANSSSVNSFVEKLCNPCGDDDSISSSVQPVFSQGDRKKFLKSLMGATPIDQIMQDDSCCLFPQKSKKQAWIPSRGMVACAFLVIGIVAISHSYHHKRLKHATNL